MKPEKDLYQILGIQRDASEEEVRKAYLVYAAKFHPDKHHGDVFFAERFQEVKAAYETLSDPEARVKYDVKKFGRSKVVRNISQNQGDQLQQSSVRPRVKMRIDLSHLDIYMALFYWINLVVWVAIKRMSQTSSTAGGHTWSLFLCCASTLIMWLFIRSLINFLRERHSNHRPIVLVVYFLLALMIGSVPLVTDWIR